MDPITPPRLNLARLPTPLVPLRRFSEKYEVPTIWMKRDDLTDTAASGNKLRKLEFSVAQALQEGATTLITSGAVQSNHCRATAIVASQLGLRSHLILRGKSSEHPDGNLLLDELVGANISFVSGADFKELDRVVEDISNQYRQQGEIPYAIPIGASDEIGLWGYIEACRELKSDFTSVNINPGFIFSAAGSGGTAGGLILGNHLYQLDTGIMSFSVSENEAYFVDKVSKDIQSWRERYKYDININELEVNIIGGHVGPGYGRADTPVFDTIRDLARTEGILLDPVYTGKAFHGLMTELSLGRFTTSSDIVFIHTGGIFSLFPHKDQLHAG